MRSLRARAILWGIALALVSVLIGGFVLFSALDAVALRRFDDVLRERHLQVVVALATVGPDAQSIADFIPDPAYSLPESGRYWQISGADGEIIGSQSLYDTVLESPANPVEGISFFNLAGPDGAIRVAAQTIRLENGGAWTVMVGQSLAALSDDRSQLRRSLIAAFLLVSVLGIGNAMLQTSAILRPIANLRKDILNRWDSNEQLTPSDYPTEVAPLVSDISALLHRNHDMFDRTRQQGADLAHALENALRHSPQ